MNLTVREMIQEIGARYPTAIVKNDYVEQPVHYFLVTLENGWQLGAGYGPTHYCDTRAPGGLADPAESRSVELAIFQPNDEWYHPETWPDLVTGWKDSDYVFMILEYISRMGRLE